MYDILSNDAPGINQPCCTLLNCDSLKKSFFTGTYIYLFAIFWMSLKHFTVATIALFSVSKQTNCALFMRDSEWVTVALHSAFWISMEVVTVMFGCYMAGAKWNCGHLSASSVYTQYIRSHILWMHVCLAVTCHLHFWQNDQDLLHSTAVSWGWNSYWNEIQHRKLTLEKKILLLLLLGLEPETFWLWVHHSIHWAIPAPHS